MKKLMVTFAVLVLALLLPFGVKAEETRAYGDFDILVTDKGTLTISKYKGNDEVVVIPDTIDSLPVTAIGKYAFEILDDPVKEVVLPESVKEIGDWAFCGSGIERINLENVSSIGSYAFADCRKLTEVDLGGMTKVEAAVFDDCKSLKTVSLGNVKEIRANAFSGCISLENIDISNVERINSSAFEGCTSLKSIRIDNAEYLSYSAFANCTSLREVELYNLKEWEGLTERYVYQKGETYELQLEVLNPFLREKRTVNEEGIIKIDGGIYNPLSECAPFYNCPELKLVKITFADDAADNGALFIDCPNINAVVYKNLNFEISQYEFSLTEPYGRKGDFITLSSIHGQSMIENESMAKIVGKSPKLVLYGDSETVKSYAESIGSIYLSEDELIEYSVVDGVCDLSALDEIPENFLRGDTRVVEVILSENITVIPDGAFYNCVNLKKVTIPKGVTEIGVRAFSNTGLESVLIPRTVKNIGKWAFEGSNSLRKIAIEDGGRPTVHGSSFNDIYKNAAIVLPESIWYLPDTLLCDIEIDNEGNDIWLDKKYADICLFVKKYSDAETFAKRMHDQNGLQYRFSIELEVNGEAIDTLPIMENGVIYAPAMDVCEALGLDLSCEEEKTIHIFGGISAVSFSYDNSAENAVLDKYGEMMIPVKPLADAFGASFKWDAENRTVVIVTPDKIGATEDFIYSIEEGYAVIQGYTGKSGYVTIPGEIEGCTVCAIGEGAFKYSNVIDVVLPDSVTDIRAEAFKGCRNLRRINLEHVENIGSSAFLRTGIYEVRLENIKTWEGARASEFNDEGYASSVTTPFKDCYSLRRIWIKWPENIDEDAPALFLGCPALKSVIMENAPNNPCKWEFHKLSGSDESYETLKNGAVVHNPEYWVLYPLPDFLTICGDALGIKEYAESIGAIYQKDFIDYTVTDGVCDLSGYDYIPEYMMAGDWRVEEVILPENLQVIPAYALASCQNLKRVKMSSNVVEIGNSAFAASALEDIDLSSVRTIGDRAFHFTYLKKVDIPNVENIGARAFSNCYYLEEIDLSKVNEMGEYAFYECRELKVVTLNSLSYLPEGAFSGCYNLLRAEINNISGFGGVDEEEISSEGPLLHPYGKEAPFYGCSRLRTLKISFTEDAKPGGRIMAVDCRLLHSAVIQGLNVPLSPSEFSIMTSAGKMWDFIDPEDTETISKYWDSSADKIYGKSPELVIYADTDEVKKYAEEAGIKYAPISDFKEYIVDENGTCDLSDFDVFPDYFLRNNKDVKKVILSENLKVIPRGAFQGCENLRQVNIPQSVVEIRESAFSGTGIINVYIPKSVEKIGRRAFSETNNLVRITIEEGGNPEIDGSAFYDIAYNAAIMLPKSITYLPDTFLQNVMTDDDGNEYWYNREWDFAGNSRCLLVKADSYAEKFAEKMYAEHGLRYEITEYPW